MTNLPNSRKGLVPVDGAVLRRTRLAVGLTGAELGQLAGLSMATVSRLETGATPATKPETLQSLAAALFASRGKTSSSRAGVAALTAEERVEVAS